MKEPKIPDDYLSKLNKSASDQTEDSSASSRGAHHSATKASKKAKASKSSKTAGAATTSRSAKNTSGAIRNTDNSKPKKGFRMGILGRLFWFFFKIGLVLLMVGAVAGFWYLNELDKDISAKFEGKRWQLPARIYARPLQLYEGLNLSAEDFQYEMSLLPYSKDPQVSKPGTYTQDESNPNRFALHTRAFQFWDGEELAARIAIEFEDGRLTSIRSLDPAQDAPYLLRIEPLEIAGILSETGEDRVLVSLDKDVPPLLVDTLLAVEDRSFYSHFGVDPKGVARALVANIQAGRRVQGASTLTQQLIKNYFLSNDRTYQRKLKEMAMALSMELNYSKEEILEAYLNEIWIGQDGDRAIHGFGLGASFYFNKTLNELEAHQIALLVGMLKSPSGFNPRRNPNDATERRNQVLDIMHSQGLISERFAERSKAMPLEVSDKERVVRTRSRYPAFLDAVQVKLRESYRSEDLQSEGLKVFTTLDPIWQHNAQQAITAKLSELDASAGLGENKLEVASVMVDPQLGEVKAIVGGRDFSVDGFNRAFDAQRPIGSLVKPFVYLTGLIQPSQFNLGTMLIDEEFEYPLESGEPWSPQNYDKREHGDVSYITALAKSYNLATARLGLNLGVERILSEMKKMGLKQSVPAYPSVLLGSLDSNAFEVAQLYSTIANGGYLTPLRLITEVAGSNGEPLPRIFDLSVKQVVPQDAAYLINSALIDVVEEGTASQLKSEFPEVLLAGKTGTTDDYRDSWYAGYSGNYLNIVWLGQDNNQPIGLSGTSGALQVWKAISKDIPMSGISMGKPPNVEFVTIDRSNGLRVSGACDTSITLPMINGTEPFGYSNCGNGIPASGNQFGQSGFLQGGQTQNGGFGQAATPNQQSLIDDAFNQSLNNFDSRNPQSNQAQMNQLLEQQSEAFFGQPLQ